METVRSVAYCNGEYTGMCGAHNHIGLGAIDCMKRCACFRWEKRRRFGMIRGSSSWGNFLCLWPVPGGEEGEEEEEGKGKQKDEAAGEKTKISMVDFLLRSWFTKPMIMCLAWPWVLDLGKISSSSSKQSQGVLTSNKHTFPYRIITINQIISGPKTLCFFSVILLTLVFLGSRFDFR